MPRVVVVGCDPGTSALDLFLMIDGDVADQISLIPKRLDSEPNLFPKTLDAWSPLNLVAGPSGYGVPLVAGHDISTDHLDQMALVRPDERGQSLGVSGFRSRVKELIASRHPSIFLPGGIHLPTIPAHRKVNAIDMGTPDKLCVAALALHQHRLLTDTPYPRATFAVVEIGSAFSAILVIHRGRLVDAHAGTRGPIGLQSSGAWDGETAYWLSPLSKNDLFHGGLRDLGDDLGEPAFAESLRKHVAALQAVTPFDRLYLSGAARRHAQNLLDDLATVTPLTSLPGANVRHAAQGAALIADGLAGGRHADLVDSLALRAASGKINDHLNHPRTSHRDVETQSP